MADTGSFPVHSGVCIGRAAGRNCVKRPRRLFAGKKCILLDENPEDDSGLARSDRQLGASRETLHQRSLSSDIELSFRCICFLDFARALDV
jgi:hypothetical protein